MATLYVVATPIGNLEDITLRALKIFRDVDLIVCEDTRRTGLLLNHFKIKKPLISYHQHSKLKKIDSLISELCQGKNIALVTDAGTPGIADPAGVLIREAEKSKIKVVPVPGPSAVTGFLSVTGFPAERFLFLGYLPKKKGRQKFLKLIKENEFPIVLFESPHRIIATLQELEAEIGPREIVIGRELTKKFEEILHGRINQIIDRVRPEGEFIIYIVSAKKKL